MTDSDLVGGDEQSLAPVDANGRFEAGLSAGAIDAGKGQTVKFAVKAEDEAGNVSPISNVAAVVIVEESGTSGLSGGEIAGIVIGSVLGAFLLVVTLYFVVTKVGCCGGDDDDDNYDFAAGGGVGNARRRSSAMEMTDVKTED